jgi:hypothetical protein
VSHPKPAISFGETFRIIDFTLKRCFVVSYLPRIGLLGVVMLGLMCGALQAEDRPTEWFQFGAGGSYMRGNWIQQNRNYGGLLFTAGWAQSPRLRWKFDGGFNFAGSSIQPAPLEGIPADALVSLSQMLGQFHGGPEITWRGKERTWFAHVLPGYTNWSLGFFGLENRSSVTSASGFSLEAGGGVDLRVRQHLAFRFQADYVSSWPDREPSSAGLNAPLPTFKSLHNDLRISMFLIGTIDRPELSPEDVAAARSKVERYQVGGGIAYSRLNRWPGHANWIGLMVAGNWAQTRWLRWTGETDVLTSGSSLIDNDANERIHQWSSRLHGGPEFTRLSHRATFFAHVLPGYTFWRLIGGTGQGIGAGERGFSLAAGGGADLYLYRKVDLRFQADYIRVWLNHTALTSFQNQPIVPGMPPYGAIRVAILVLKTGERRQKA